MTKVKRSLAVLLALIMVLTIAPINSFALTSDIFPEASLDDGNQSSWVITPVIYRNVNAGIDGAEEDWQPTTKVKPGEEVRVRVTMKTDYEAGSTDLMLAFDNRIFTGADTLNAANTNTLSVNTAEGSFAANYLSDNKSQYICYLNPDSTMWDDLNGLANWYTLDENGDVVPVPYVDNYIYNNYDWVKVSIMFATASNAYVWTGTEWMFEIPLTVLDKPAVTPLIAEGETDANIAANYGGADVDIEPAFITVVDALSGAGHLYDDPDYGESPYDVDVVGLQGTSRVNPDTNKQETFYLDTWQPQVTGYDAHVTTNGTAIFDANGGYFEGAEDDPDTEDVDESALAYKEGYYGATKTIGTSDTDTTIITPTPTHEKGYKFLGWGTTKTATAADKVSSVSFDFEDTTYYAIWEYYNYTFNVNGGSWDAAGTDTADRVIDGSAGKTVAYTVDGTEVKPVKSGFDFKGWATTADATSANATVTPAEDYTFYAYYEAQSGTPYTINTYTMDVDGNYPDTPAVTNGSGTYGAPVDVTPELGTGFYADTTHEGYKATGVVGTDNVFTIYVARDKYTVTFAPAGGYLDGDKAATADKPVEAYYEKVIDVPTVARDGYTGGWPEGTGTTVTVDGNKTITAVWTESTTTLGTISAVYTDTDGVEQTVTVLDKDELAALVADLGYTPKTGSTLYIAATEPANMAEGDVFIPFEKLPAAAIHYEVDADNAANNIAVEIAADGSTSATLAYAPVDYTVTYELGADDATIAAATQDFAYGTEINTADLAEPERKGYTFLGWATSAENAETGTIADTATVKGDMSLYAVWQADKANVGGVDGTYTDENGDEQKVEILTKEELENIIGEDEGTSDGNIVIAPEKPADFDEENDIFIDTDDIFPTEDGYILDPDATTPIVVPVTPGEDTDVTIPVVLATYTVTYNANADGVTVTPATADVKHGDTIVKTSATPSDRAGYTFLGWATTADATAAEDITVTGDMTVYAVWQADKANVGGVDGTYTDENGDEQKVEILTKEELENIIGEDEGTSDGNIVIAPEKPADFDEENDIFIDTDDIFPTEDGYILDPDATTPIVVPVTPGAETEVTIPVVLATYTVTYDVNAENVAINPATVAATHGSVLNKANTAVPTDREGYEFLGWAKTADATAAEDITVTGDMTIYAVWQAKEYDVEFVIPGIADPYHTDKVVYGTAVQYPADPTEADLPAGKAFVSWMPQAITSKKAEKETVTAQLEDINYFVTLWVVNNDGDLEEYDTLSTTYGKAVEIPAADDASERYGYNATGWYTAQTGGDEVSEGAYTVTADADIYLQYAAKTDIGVYLYAEEALETELDSTTATYGEYLVLTTETQFDAVPGKTVDHWVVSDGDTTVKLTLDENGKSNYLVETEEDIFVYAVWSTNDCTVTYNVNAADATIANATGSFPYGTVLTKANTETPVRDGYEFLGWATTADAKAAEDITVDGNIEIFAVWTAEKHTINYVVDGKPYDSAEYAFGADVTVLEVNEEGYDFSGWTWTYVDGDGNTQTTTEPATMPAYDLTATGTLTGKQITVTFNADGGYFNGDKANTADATYTAACGSNVVVPTVAKDGYTLVGWTYVDADGNTQTIAAPVTMPTKDTTYTAKWSSGQSTYAVEIYIMDLDGDYGVPFKTSGIVAATDAVVTLTAEVRPGFTFVESLSKTEGTVTADNALVLKLYYSRNEYEVVFDGTAYTYYHGESLVAPEAAEVEGKTFLGWTDTEGSTTTVELPETVSAPGTYYPVYSANTYTITYILNGEQYGEVESYEFGEEISIRDDVKQTGYSFSGWTPEALPAEMPAENIVVEGTLTINTYTVNYLDAEGNVFETYKVTYGDTIPVPDGKPTKDYSVFDSWNNDLTVMPDRDLDIAPIFNKVPVKLIARDGSTTVIDEDRKIIYGLQNKLTLDLLNNVYLDVEGDGTIVYETIQDNWYGTGVIVRVRDNETGELVEGQEYVIVVFGDINGDGWITSVDTTAIREEISYVSAWSRGADADIYKVYAADVNRDGRLSSIDTTAIREQIGYIADIDQVTAPAGN